tara:strand:- start:994 stop:1572 length:579 start_codon:yes stop_codon:yes gene_type:complete
MFIIKKNYYLIIGNTKDIKLKNIKKKNKFNIIYRNIGTEEKITDLYKFRVACKNKRIKLFIANDIKLAIELGSDGIYISAYNKNLKFNRYISSKFAIIGSAHNIRDIAIKKRQGCTNIFLSRLFETDYADKKGYLGLIRFNLLQKIFKNYVLSPLGGVRLSNLNKIKDVDCNSFAILSEVKKKPAKIFSRLF